jgi:hypothetical protein
MTNALAFLKAHWPWIVGTGLPVLASILMALVNRFTPADKPRPRWAQIIGGLAMLIVDLLALIPRKGNVGLLGPVNLPGLPSVPKRKDEPPPSGAASLLPFVLAVGAGLGIAAMGSGCGSLESKLWRATTTTALVAVDCHRALDLVQEDHETQARERDEHGGFKLSDDVLRTRRAHEDKAEKACDAAYVTALAAESAVPLVAQGRLAPKDVMGWIAKLGGVVKAAVEALTVFGVNLEVPR